MKEITIEDLKSQIFQKIGYATMCWNPRPAGVFDSTDCAKTGDEIMELVKQYAASLNRQGCRWVKASERKSEHRKSVCCKKNGHYFQACYDKSVDCYVTYMTYDNVAKIPLNEVEWLDESIEPCATSSENYWKQRCEAAEEVFNCLPDYIKFDTRKDEAMYDDAHKAWQELKQTPSPTGDRDCEELKKRVSELEKIVGYIERNAGKINEHTWKVYKEQILGHCEDAKPNNF